MKAQLLGRLKRRGKRPPSPATTGRLTMRRASKSYRFRILLAMLVGVPLAVNIGPRTETVSPTFRAATSETFWNTICAEVFAVMVANPPSRVTRQALQREGIGAELRSDCGRHAGFH